MTSTIAPALAVFPLLAVLAHLPGCGRGFVVYDSPEQFEYRVAHLQKIPVESSAAVPSAPGFGFQQAGDGRIRITPPAGTTSLGVSTGALAASPGAPRPNAALLLEGDGSEHTIPVPSAPRDVPSFLGIVAYRPITSLTVPGPIRSLSFERPR